MKLVYNTDQRPLLSQALIDLDILKLLMLCEPSFTEQTASDWAIRYYSSDPAELMERYAIFQELTDLSQVTDAYNRVVTLREELDKLSRAADRLHEVLYRYRTLTSFLELIQTVCQSIPVNTKSRRLMELTEFLTEIQAAPEYAAIRKAVDEFREQLPLPRYMYVGINTREDGEPVDIAILHDSMESEELQALIDMQAPTAPSKGLFPDIRYTREQYGSHFEEYLLHYLEKHYHADIQKLYKRLQGVQAFHTQELLELEESLRFYKIGLQMHTLFLSRGYTLCRPDPTGSQLSAEDLMYPDLALHMDSLEGKPIRVASGSGTLITGANHSGKTSYLKTIGQSLVLAQFGFFVPASSYSYHPFQNLHTLFSAGEDSSMSVSRMGVEIQKLTGILNEATAQDLVLINEPMTSTNPVEAVSICAELMEHFLGKHITHLVVTHLYDIYYLLQSRLSEADKQRMNSLVTESYYDPKKGMVHSYTLIVSPPRGNSYAMETAKQFGITLSDLLTDPALVEEASAFCADEDVESIYQGGAHNGLSD